MVTQHQGTPASGFVLANDANASRAYMLVSNCKRIGSHRLVVTCHDAQHLPMLTLATPEDLEGPC